MRPETGKGGHSKCIHLGSSLSFSTFIKSNFPRFSTCSPTFGCTMTMPRPPGPAIWVGSGQRMATRSWRTSSCRPRPHPLAAGAVPGLFDRPTQSELAAAGFEGCSDCGQRLFRPFWNCPGSRKYAPPVGSPSTRPLWARSRRPGNRRHREAGLRECSAPIAGGAFERNRFRFRRRHRKKYWHPGCSDRTSSCHVTSRQDCSQRHNGLLPSAGNASRDLVTSCVWNQTGTCLNHFAHIYINVNTPQMKTTTLVQDRPYSQGLDSLSHSAVRCV